MADDVKTIAHDEVELARLEIERSARSAAAHAATILLGGIVALVGLGLLCVSAVDALEPAIPQLWLRLLIMAGVYVVVGGGVAALFARRLPREATPDMRSVAKGAERTADAVREGIQDD
jgi:hypothetical protein